MSAHTELDAKVADVFAGKVVRKDLVRRVKVGANVPAYVLEYLLGKYCATDDPVALEGGLRLVNLILAENFVHPDEANKAQSRVRERGRHGLIDKIKVRYLAEDDKYWAELVHFGHRYVHIPEKYIREYDRLLVGGIWAQIEIQHLFDEEAKGSHRSPFWIEKLQPIQVATFDFADYCEGRRKLSTDEWTDLLLRSIGLEPHYFDRRRKLLLLLRLLPLCEANYNLIELGPRGTGKSYSFQELSPYVILLTGPTTVANLFYNLATSRIGLVGLWDAVAFDEVADLQKMPREVITTLKTYCESGTFARGKEALSGHASVALFGNTNQPVEVMVRSSHLFMPLPEVIREDMAFLDRLHCYLPGWEIPKMRTEFFTDHYGFVVDYLAEALRELRRRNYAEVLDRHFSLGGHLNARDVKAVRKTVSGLVKLLYPDGEVGHEDLAEVLEIALEGRRRVKEQLKKMGSFEYHQTSFSYLDQETQTERHVGVPEEGGRNLIAQEALPPGSVYGASVDAEGKVGLFRIEVGTTDGSGKLHVNGAPERTTRDSIQRAFAYLDGHKAQLTVERVFASTDFHVQVIDLLANRVPCDAGIAMFLSLYSALRKASSSAASICVGDLTVQGTVRTVPALGELLRIAMDNGARRALLPTESKRALLEVDAEVIEHVDPIFFSDPISAATKALSTE